MLQHTAKKMVDIYTATPKKICITHLLLPKKLTMRYLLIVLFIFSFNDLFAQKYRSLGNPKDKDYFDNQVEKIFHTRLSFLKATFNRNAKDDMVSKDTFLLYIPFKAESERAMLQNLENGGGMIPFVFRNDLLKEFPEIKIFSLSVPCITGKNVTVNYHYNKDGSISFFSQLQKRWLTQHCTGPK